MSTCFTNQAKTKLITMNKNEDNVLKFHHRWKIDNFDCLCRESNFKFGPIYTNVFPKQLNKSVDYGLKFYLRLFPEFIEDQKANLSVFLCLEDFKNDCTINTKFKISLIDTEGRKFNVKEDAKRFGKEDCFGFEKFALIDQNFLQANQNLTLFCEVEVGNSEIPIPNDFQLDMPPNSPKIWESYSHINADYRVQQVECKWSIADFNFLINSPDSEHDKVVSYKSEQFFVPENKEIGFFILAILNKKEEKSSIDDYMSLYLYFQSKNVEKIMVSYQLSILDCKGNQFVTGEGRGEMTEGVKGAKGCPEFIKLGEILDQTSCLLPQNILTIAAKISINDLSEPLVKKERQQMELYPINGALDKKLLSQSPEINNPHQQQQARINNKQQEQKVEINKNMRSSKMPNEDKSNYQNTGNRSLRGLYTRKIPEYYILTQGEKRAGKSTTINAWANYLNYDFDKAKTNKFVQMIPSNDENEQPGSGDSITKVPVGLNNARKLILELAEPMVRMQSTVRSNITKIVNSIDLLKNSPEDKNKLMQNLYVEDLLAVALEYPSTVCTSVRCTEVIQVEGEYKVHYKTQCHPRCYLDNVGINTVGDPSLKNCSAMNGDHVCTICGCDWSKHMNTKMQFTKVKRPIIDEVKGEEIKTKQVARFKMIEEFIDSEIQYIEQMKASMKNYEDELKVIEETSTNLFSYHLTTNSNIPYNKFLEPYLDLLMNEETKKASSVSSYSLSKYESLQRMKDTHRERVKILMDAINRNKQKPVQMHDIFTCRDVLFGLKLTGAQFKQIMETGWFVKKKSFDHRIAEKSLDLRDVILDHPNSFRKK